MSSMQDMLRQEHAQAEEHHKYQMSSMQEKCAFHSAYLCITMYASCTEPHL